MRLGLVGMMACGGGAAGGPMEGVLDGPLQVELLEEQVAQVVPLGGGEAYTVPRTTLPPQAKEGDVVRGGQVDVELGERLARQVRELRARLAVPIPDGLDLEAGASASLTESKER